MGRVEAPLDGRRFWLWLGAVLVLAALLRGLFPTADPPWHASVGITWHDEGPWVHNARNRALFGAWSLDQWNPMFLAPVFTGLEYVSFATFGVGTWQARLVSEALGWVSVLAIGLGVASLAGRRAGLYAAALLATNYIYVMWNRAALMETTMTGFIVIGWACYAGAARRPWLGLVAGLAALLAFFTKAAAVFFVGALGLEALAAIVIPAFSASAGRAPDAGADLRSDARAGLWTLAGLALFGVVALAVFVVPYWTEFRFYNWQMSVTRKPAYTLRAFVDRASWLPIAHDFFTRQWLVTVVALASLVALVAQWRRARPAERLLALWVLVGVVELVFHDVGNERRLVFLIPALVALAAIALGRGRLVPAGVAAAPRRTALLLAPLVFYSLYIVVGAMARLPFLYQIGPGVRLSAAIALVLGVWMVLAWPKVVAWISNAWIAPAAATALVLTALAGDVLQFGQWAAERTYENITASRLVGSWLPPGTLVHGKLANGLALENRIRPVFVGRGFGNYGDRTARPDIRYVLTYVSPRTGYEGPVILDVLAAHPGWKVLHVFDVAETRTGYDKAALIAKPGASPTAIPIPAGR